MTDEIRGWRDALNVLETELVYYETAVRQRKRAKDESEYMKARLAATKCARDALARKLEKLMTAGSDE